MRRRFPRTAVIAACEPLLLGAGLGFWGCGTTQDLEQTPASSVEQTMTTEIWAESTTTVGQAQTTVSTSSPGATSTVTTLHKKELKWRETATVEGGTVTVDAPVVDPAAKSSHPGFIVIYCMVTITNTGKTPISYARMTSIWRDEVVGAGGSARKQRPVDRQPWRWERCLQGWRSLEPCVSTFTKTMLQS